MRRTVTVLLCFLIGGLLAASSASADWRWAPPHFQAHKVTYTCKTYTYKCLRHTYLKERHRLHRKFVRFNQRRLQEWNHWTRLYIPTCTWYGESGPGPKYAHYRYVMPNSAGSGAYGKFQMMPSTYRAHAKYYDWSPLDQEIASRRLFWVAGTQPWSAC